MAMVIFFNFECLIKRKSNYFSPDGNENPFAFFFKKQKIEMYSGYNAPKNGIVVLLKNYKLIIRPNKLVFDAKVYLE
jgi:hypothetical protein